MNTRIDPLHLLGQLASAEKKITILKKYVSEGNDKNQFDLIYQNLVKAESALNRAFHQAQDVDYSK